MYTLYIRGGAVSGRHIFGPVIGNASHIGYLAFIIILKNCLFLYILQIFPFNIMLLFHFYLESIFWVGGGEGATVGP